MQSYGDLANDVMPQNRFNKNVIFYPSQSISQKPNFFEIFMKCYLDTFAV